MKKSALAIVIAALSLSTAAHAAEVYNKDGNKLDLYGKIKGLHYFSKDKSNDGDTSYVRMGFKGQTQITDTLTGYGQWEYQFNTNHAESEGSSSDKTRLGFAGLKFADFGSIDYGRNYGILYDVESYTDVFPEFGGDGTERTDNFMTGRTGNVLTYRNNDFFGLVDGLKFGLQYQGKNDAKNTNGRSAPKTQNGEGFGLSASYDVADTGVSIVGAYTSSNRTGQQQNDFYGHGDSRATSWGTGLKYDANNVYLAAIYSETNHMTPVSGGGHSGTANKAQNVELVAQYQFDFGLRPSLGYIQTKGKDIEGIGDEDLVNYIDVGATYYFNKNMNAYVDYKINQLDDDNKLGLNTDDIVALGLVYQF